MRDQWFSTNQHSKENIKQVNLTGDEDDKWR